MSVGSYTYTEDVLPRVGETIPLDGLGPTVVVEAIEQDEDGRDVIVAVRLDPKPGGTAEA